MTVILESFEIESPEHGAQFTIELAEELDDPHIEFIEKQWCPILQYQYDLALLNFFQLPDASRTDEKWHEMLGTFGAQDAHWVWRNKCAVARGSNRTVFGLLNATNLEAAMLLYFGNMSRDLEHTMPIVYVDYIAVAPWNREAIQHPQRFRGLGTVLLGAAVARSLSMGWEGRCGLHSLPQAEGFYHQLGMRDFGIDAAYLSLRYFEFNAHAARRFIEEGYL